MPRRCHLCLTLLVLPAVLTTPATASEDAPTVVVRLTDHEATPTYEVLDRDAYEDLKSTIKQENRLHTQALSTARREWSQRYAGMFPDHRIHRREIFLEGGPYGNDEQARRKLVEMNRRLHDSQKAEKKRNAEWNTRPRQSTRRRGNRAFSTQSTHTSDAKQVKAARNLYIDALKTLMQENTSPSSTKKEPVPMPVVY